MRKKTINKIKEVKLTLEKAERMLEEILATPLPPGKTHLDVLCEFLDKADEKEKKNEDA